MSPLMVPLSTRLNRGPLTESLKFFYTYQLLILMEPWQTQGQPFLVSPETIMVNSSTETLHLHPHWRSLSQVSYTFEFHRCTIPPEIICDLLRDRNPILVCNSTTSQDEHLIRRENVYRLGCIIYEVCSTCILDDFLFLALGLA